MIDFPIAELLDASISLIWLERHLHPAGFTYSHCGSPKRRVFHAHGHIPGYRCRACDGYYTLLTGTVFEKTRQSPAMRVLLLRGIAKGEQTVYLTPELGLSRKQVHTLRQRVQGNLNQTAPTRPMASTTFEADGCNRTLGKTSTPHRDPADPHVAERISAKDTGLTPTIVPPSSVGVARDGRAPLSGV
jgi:transposase-like protein